jgi:hypothetical protein
MANTFEIHDPEATPIDKEWSIDIEAKMLELNLTQSLKHEEGLTLKVMCSKVDWSVWNRPPLLPNTSTLAIYLEVVHAFYPRMFVECLAENDDVHLFEDMDS